VANHKTKLELTWIGKENRPKLGAEDSGGGPGEALPPAARVRLEKGGD